MPDPPTELPSEAADLYRLALDEFTPARNQLVKALKAEKRKSEADAVAQLRKPPATAWAVNQVARSRPELIESVQDAAAGLRGAMEQAVAGDRSALSEAQSAERKAISAATDAAGALLTEAGHAAGDPARRKMSETLRAAALDPGAAESLRTGTLTNDVATTGLAFDLTAAAVPRPNRPARVEPEPARSPTAADLPTSLTPPTPPTPAAADTTLDRRADELHQRRVERKRQELEAELAVLRQRAARLAEQVEDAEAGLAELHKRTAKALDAVTETEAELAALVGP
jgi:hypothetical protein